MLRKFSNSVRRKGSGVSAACKFRFDFHIDYVDGLPSKVRHCRAQLKRSPKTNISELHPASGGRCDMGETLSFVATMYRTPEGTFEGKQYTFVLQVPAKPDKPSTDKLLVLGDCVLDLARFAPNVDVSGQRLALAVPTKLKRVAQVHGTVTVTIVQAKMALDGLTNISGTEALSSAPLGMEQDLSGFSDYDGEGGATPKGGRTGGLSGSSGSRGLRPPLASHTSPEGNTRGSSKTLARMSSASKAVRNSFGAGSGHTDRSDSKSQGGSNTPLTPSSGLPITPPEKQRSVGSLSGGTRQSPAAAPPAASTGRRFGTGYSLSQQSSAGVDAYDSAQHTPSEKALQSPSANTTSANGGIGGSLRSNRTAPSPASKLTALRASTPEEEEEDAVRTPTRAELSGRHIFDEEKSTALSLGEMVQDESSSLSEMSVEGDSRDGGAARGASADRKDSSNSASRNASARNDHPQVDLAADRKLAGLSAKLGGGPVRADSMGSKIGTEMSAFSETITAPRQLQHVRGKLQPMQGVQEGTADLGFETSAMECTGALSDRVDTDELLDSTVEGALASNKAMEAQGPSKYSWRRAAGAIKVSNAANSSTVAQEAATPKASKARLENSQLGTGDVNKGSARQGASTGLLGSGSESEDWTLGGGSSFADGKPAAASAQKRRGENGAMDADLLDDNLALPQTQGRDAPYGGLVQDPMVSIAPDGMMSTIQDQSRMGGGLSDLGADSAMRSHGGNDPMHGTLNLVPPASLTPPDMLPGLLKPLGSGTATGTSQASNDRALPPSQLSKGGGLVGDAGQGGMGGDDRLLQERVAKLEKELQIEKESSQAAMMALKKDIDVEKESSKAALTQVQGELEQERAKSKASVGRVRKDLESERDSVNAALKEVRADLDSERERAKTLSSTLEATAERSSTITSQLEAANKQVTELKVMRRELEGSRREIEALRKSSADGGAAQKELSTVRRELENTKKQADVARTDVEEMREEYDRLKKQDEKLDAAKEETERLRVQLKEARDSATVAERRHQDEQQAVLDRMGRETNGKDIQEREQLQIQLQQQLQTSEELVQELKSRLEQREAAVRDLTEVNNTLSVSATQAKGMKGELAQAQEERDKAVEEVARLDDALSALQNGPNVELMQAWDTERRELLQDLEAAENRVLGMQTQVADGDMELHNLRKSSEQVKREKVALQNDALHLTERTMELEHANRMLTNEVSEKKAGRAKSMRDSWSLDGGGLSPMPSTADDGTTKSKKPKVVDVADYEKVVAELAELKLEFALGQERETIMRHEVQKARERKAQLEAKLTKVENSMYGGLARLPGAGSRNDDS